ncbi:MAG: hypothetical protein L6R38_002825 [Xanthoria sp. 2 TBL-2021]|nr:MAG: hypothetical protein L6R38_002825 [Xanthoria sp. 2 TBL-2021]
MEPFNWYPKSTIDRHNDTYPYISPGKYIGSLPNKIVVITGAGRGIGRATSLAFAAAGANVVCVARTKSDLDAVVHSIAEKGHPKAHAIAGDVTDPSLPSRLIQETEEMFGNPIDILINNAGISRISNIEHDRDYSIPWHVIDINMRGSMALIHALAPSMIGRKKGTIINVVSVLASENPEYFTAYSAAKAGMLKATHIMDREFREHGIQTYAVHPGMIAETTLGHGALNPEAQEKSPSVKEFMGRFVPSMNDSLALAADTFVALAADPDARFMSGRYVDATQDLGQVLAEAKKGLEGRIEKEGLYTLKVDTL